MNYSERILKKIRMEKIMKLDKQYRRKKALDDMLQSFHNGDSLYRMYKIALKFDYPYSYQTFLKDLDKLHRQSKITKIRKGNHKVAWAGEYI